MVTEARVEMLKDAVSASSYDSYSKRLANVMKISGKKTLQEVIDDPIGVHKKLAEYFKAKGSLKPSTMANYLVPILKTMSINKEYQTKHQQQYTAWLNYMKEYRDAETSNYKKNTLTDEQKEKWVTFEEMQGKYMELVDDPTVYTNKRKHFHFLLVALFTHLRPKRSDYGAVKLLNKRPKNMDQGNYIVLSKGDPVLVLNHYKTSHVYKAIIEKIPPELYAVLTKSVKAFPRAYLFLSSQDQPYLKNKSFSEFVRTTMMELFNKKMGVSLWRHVYVSEKMDFNKMSLEALEQEAQLMGTSVNTQMLTYKTTHAPPASTAPKVSRHQKDDKKELRKIIEAGTETCDCKCVKTSK
jgi:hypothetical protein